MEFISWSLNTIERWNIGCGLCDGRLGEVAGQLLIGFCFALAYQQTQKTRAALQGPQSLPVMILKWAKTLALRLWRLWMMQCGSHLGEAFSAAKEYGSFWRLVAIVHWNATCRPNPNNPNLYFSPPTHHP